MKVKTAAESLVTTIAAAAALVLVNALTCGVRSKVDLTEQKVYTLSDASARFVRALPEKVLVKAYFDKVPAEHADKQRYIEGLLSEYAEASGGKLTWEKVIPEDKPDVQQALQAQGIQKVPVPALKDDKFELNLIYFTVQFVYLDKKETWAPDANFFRQDLEGLEYEYTTLLRRLTGTEKKKVGITTGFGEPQKTQLVTHPRAVGLAELYDVTPVNWQTSPKDIEKLDVLIVNGPTQPVSETAAYYLDQHLMKGKPVLFLVPGIRWQRGGNQPEIPNFVQQDQPYLGMPVDNGLWPQLAHYGFEVGKDTVIDGQHGARGVIPIGTPPLLTHVFFPLTQVKAGGRNQVLEGIDIVAMPFVSTVKVAPGAAGVVATPLLETSPVSFARADIQVITREMKIEAPKEGRGPFTVAWAATGSFPSFFAGKPRPAGVEPPAAPSDDLMSATDTPAQSPAGARVIVVGSAAFASDDDLGPTLQTPFGGGFVNGFRMLHNMVDWLAQEVDLIAVRGKAVARPLVGVEDDTRLWVKYGNLAGVPLAFVAVGIVLRQLRQRRRRTVKL